VSRRFVVLPDPAAVAEAAADRFVAAARNAIRRRGRFMVALSGGSTPKAVYGLLAAPPRASAVDWSRVELFWGDERAVPPDDPASNFGLARDLLLGHVSGPRAGQVHRMPADARNRDLAARRYQEALARTFRLDAAGTERPSFDLIWLGMGGDGHTASLFPGSPLLAERKRWVVPVDAPPSAPIAGRLSLTLPVLNAARSVMFVVTGADKFPALSVVRSGSRRLPAGLVRARSTLWLVDAAAMGQDRAR